MKKVLLGFLICSFLSSFVSAQAPCRPSKHARLPVITSLTYHKARPKLIAMGWQPVQTINQNKAKDDPNISYGNGAIFWKRGYWEVEFCSGTGLAACGFLFKNAYGNRLRVTTQGEELIKPRAFARVSSYEFVCN